MSQPKRVAYVVKRYPRYSETFIVNEILAHEAAGLELEIFSLNAPVDSHFQDIIAKVRAPVTYLSASGLKLDEFWKEVEKSASFIPQFWQRLAKLGSTDAKELWQAAKLARAVVTGGLEHIHAHFATSATSVARLAAGLANVSYSFTAHAKDIFHESVDPKDLAQKLADAKDLITVSDFNLDYLQGQFPEYAHKIRRIYNGLDLERFPYEAMANRERRIVSVGRLVEKKGFADLIAACALLQSRGLEFHCDIIGSGELEADLRTLIAELAVSDRVSLLGPRPQQELAQHVQRASVFAAPCLVGDDGNRDGLPTVLLEAMALGTPCVSTDVTGIPEIIRDKETGLQVPQRNPQALALALERLLTQTELAQDLA
ncbi:MAG: glycosyltransferase, partial [Trueperaceae bacterium]|nr:glycosyltransferase [Trueperaceae bacterium]